MAALFLIALVLLFPLRVALDLASARSPAISARGASGTVWSGEIEGLRLGPVPLGVVTARLRPLPLFAGRTELAIARAGPAPFSAILARRGESFAIRNAQGSVALAEGLGGLPVSAAGFSGFSYVVVDGRCTEADGTVSLTLPALSPLMSGDLVLGGRARCEGGKLLVPMTGPTGMEALTLRLAGDGRWTAELSLRGLPPEVGEPLLRQGFTARGDAIGASASGRF